MSDKLTIKEAKDLFERGFREYKIFEKGAEMLRTLESLEQIAKETEARVAKARADESEVLAERKKHDDAIGVAKENAAATVKSAEAECAKLKAACERDIATSIEKFSDVEKSHLEKLHELSEHVESTNLVLSGMEAQKAKLEAEITELEKIKEKARKALGV